MFDYMESKKFSIGDIVSLKSHPYNFDLTNVIVSGDHLGVPPLMVVIEVFISKQNVYGIDHPIAFKYKCTWFSPKQYKFIESTFLEADLKLIRPSDMDISKSALKRGDRITLKSSSLELGKKKSSITYDDNSSISIGKQTTTNSLLSFLPPVLMVIDVKEHKTKEVTIDKKTSISVRIVHSWDVKFSYFDPKDDRESIYTLPLETLSLIEEVDSEKLLKIQSSINSGKHLGVINDGVVSLLHPKSISFRSGLYYLKGYDLLSNKNEDYEITDDTTLKEYKSPYKAQVPKFDIGKEPKSATPEYIAKEITEGIKTAKKNKTFIRIKYKNRNELLSYRTIKNYKIISVKEDKMDVTYLVGFCLLRQDERNFRIDRIQSLQELKLKFK